jgi:ABC-type glycerol-3-phosphate transport system substrate-binding protein
MKAKLFVLFAVVMLALTACASPATTAPVPSPVTVKETVVVTQAPVKETVVVKETVPAAEKVELTWLVFESPVLTSAFWDAAIADSLKSANIPNLTVKRINTPGIDRSTYAKQLIASGIVPDLMQSINTQDFVDSGLLMPWDQKWCEDHFVLPMGSALGGKIWQAPTNSQIIPFVFYNKDIFNKVGVQVPTNWAQFQDVVKKLKAAGYKPLQVVGAGDGIWASGMTLSGIVSADVLASTPNWVAQRKAGKVKFSDSNMAAAFAKFKWLVDNGGIDKADLGVAYADANQAFIDQKAAMYFMGSWFLSQAGKDAKFNTGVFLFPRDDGKVVVPFNVGGGIHMSAKTQHPTEMQAFAKAAALSPAMMKDLIEKDGAFPMVKGMTLANYGVTVSDLFKQGYSYVGKDGTTVVDAFAWVNNDSALLAGMTDEFNKSAQSIINGTDITAELARLDKVWDQAAKK